MATAILTAQRVREVLNYNPETGILSWRVKPNSKILLGAKAGNPHVRGYLDVGIDHKRYLCHRIAWLHFYGEWPKHQIDHINGIRTDNRIANLRDVPAGVNNQNILKARSDNSNGGLTGVHLDRKTNKWRAKLQLNGKQIYGGLFDTPEEARAKYVEMKRQYHPGCTI